VDPIDDVEFVGTLRGDVLAGERDLLGDCRVVQLTDELDAASAGEDAEIDLRKAEPRVLVGESEITRHRGLEPAAQTVPADLGDDGDGELGDELVVIPPGTRGGVLVGELVDVGPGTEVALRARKNDDPERDPVVALVLRFEQFQSRDEVVPELLAERVQRVGAVQRNPADAGLFVELDDRRIELFAHERTRVRGEYIVTAVHLSASVVVAILARPIAFRLFYRGSVEPIKTVRP
jgi:hypothetical protein